MGHNGSPGISNPRPYQGWLQTTTTLGSTSSKLRTWKESLRTDVVQFFFKVENP